MKMKRNSPSCTMRRLDPLHSFFVLSLLSASASAADVKINYQDHVRPVFENRCLNCHNPDKKKGGLDLSTFASTMAGGSGGVSLEPGDVNSPLLKCVTFEKEPFMPPKSDKIPAAEIDIISKWIVGGLLDSATSTAKIKKKQNFDMATSANPLAKPEGPPPMPENLLLDPVVETRRANSINSLAHSPWAPLIAVSGERQVLLFHSETAELLGVLPFPEGSPMCVGFSRNGTIVYAGGGVSGKNGIVALWEVKTGKRVATVGEEFDSVLACDITPDHKLVALGGPGRKVKIYNTATGACVSTIKKHTDWVLSCSFSPDGVLLATGDRNGGLYVWESATGNEFYNLKGHEKAVHAVSWRPDSNVVASASEDGSIRWWEMGGGTQIKTFNGAGGKAVLTVNYAADGRLIAGGRDGKVHIFAPDGNQKREFLPTEGAALVMQSCFTPDGKRCLTGTFNGEVKFWDTEKEAKDAPPLVVIANPPSIAARLAALNKDLADKQAAVKQAQAAAAEKEKMVAAAQAEAAAIQQQLATVQAEEKKSAELKTQIKSAVDKLEQAKAKFATELAAANQQLSGLAKPLAPSPMPAGMSEPVTTALVQATQAEEAVNDIGKTLAETKIKDLTEVIARHDAEIAQMKARMPQADQQMVALTAKKAEMEKAMTPKQQAIDAAMKIYNDAKSAVDAAGSTVAGAQKLINTWLAAKENKTVILTTSEVAALKDSVESLKAEIPALEAEIKATTEKKSATPPPAPEQVKKMETQIATAAKRLEEARKELPKAEADLAEKTKAAETAKQVYQSLLPKQG